MDKQGLLAAMRSGRERFLAEIAGVSEQDFAIPGRFRPNGEWSYKDLVAHVGYWEDRTAQMFADLLEGRAPSDDPRDLDEVNLAVYQAHRHQAAAEVRDYEAAAYERLLALVERAMEDDLFDPLRFAAMDGRPFVEEVTYNSYGHYEQHGI